MGGFASIRGRNLYRVMQFVCGVSFMMYGYDAGVLGGVVLHQPFLDAIDNPTGVWIIPMIGSSYSLAACVTSLIVATFAFRIGRRGTILLGNAAAIVGSVIQASSYSVPQLIVGRVITGFAIGCISSAVPTYLNETGIESDDRGPANAFNAILLISGVPIAYWIDYGFTKMYNQASWRVPIIFQCVFAILSGAGMYLLPDTPRYYYAKNRHTEGDDALCRLNDLPLESEKVQNTKREILLAIEAELEASSGIHWKQFLTSGITDHTPMKIIRRLAICFWLPVVREWMGSSLMAYWTTQILANVGAKPSLVTLLAGVLNIFYALGTVPLYFTVERIGRRAIMMWGAVVLSILMLVFLVLNAVPATPGTQWAGIGIIFAFVFVFGYSWQGSVWLYCSEIAPLEYRHIGGSFTAFGEWLSTFIFVFAGPIGLENIGWRFWIVILVGDIAGIIFVYLLCPETTRKSLEEIDFIFAKTGQLASLAQRKEDLEAKLAGGEEIEVAGTVLESEHVTKVA